MGCPTAQSCVRAAGVVRGDECVRAGTHLPKGQRNEDASEALVLQRPNEPFDERDAAVVANGAEARLDRAAFAPTLERLASELPVLVGDDVLGFGFGVAESSNQEVADLRAGWLLAEDADAHDSPGEVVHNDGQPPPERPSRR